MDNFSKKNTKYSTLNKTVRNDSSIMAGTLGSKHNEKMKEIEKIQNSIPQLRTNLDELYAKLHRFQNPRESLQKLEKERDGIAKQLNEYVGEEHELMMQDTKSKPKVKKKKKKKHESSSEEDVSLPIQKKKSKKKKVTTVFGNKEYTKLNEEMKEITQQISVLNSDFHVKIQECKTEQEIEKLETKIKKLEENDQEVEYFDKTSELIVKYNENISKPKAKRKKKKSSNFFEDLQHDDSDDDDNFELFNKYMQVTSNEKFTRSNNKRIITCSTCKIPKVLLLNEGTMICQKCGETDSILMDSDKPSFRNPVAEPKQNAYKRSNHYAELMNQSQAKESTEIPDEVMDMIRCELESIQFNDMSKMTKAKMKNILRDIGLSKYYENAMLIINMFRGGVSEEIPRETRETVTAMIDELQSVWPKHKKKGMKNFFNNNFVFRRVYEFLGDTKRARTYPQLSRTKTEEYDEILDAMIKDLGWIDPDA
jgi:hypothetical protein